MTRLSGSVADGRTAGAHDHLCWVFADRSDFVARSVEFLQAGLASGERLIYVGSVEPEALTADLAPLGDIDGLLASGALVISSLPHVYPSGAVIDPAHQVAEYRRRTHEAVAAGFSGLRVAADATAMVVTPEQRRAFRHYEQQVDRLMALEPMAAMCGYDRTQLGEEAVSELACIHPAGGGHEMPFHLFALDGERHALTGECDIASEEFFERAVEGVVSEGADLRIDLSRSDFVDHRALVVLHQRAAAAGPRVVLEGVRPTTRKVVSILGLTHLSIGVSS